MVLGVIVTYLPVWHAGFIWDDDYHLTDNPCIIGPLGFVGIWTTHIYQFFPLVLSTFWLEHALWGLAPVPYHLVNVLQQAGCALLLWQVLKNLQIPGAWLGAALWALHPVQVESVAWISEMKNTESGLFYLLAILFFVRWLKADDAGARSEARRNYALTLLFAALAMGGKSSTVVLPAVLFLCAWWVENRFPWQRFGRLAPVILLSVISTAITIWPVAPDPSVVADPQWAQSWPQRVATSGDVIWFYLGKLLWPHPLMAVYPRWRIDAHQLASYLPLLTALIVGLGLWFWRESRLVRPAFFALAYFLVVLAPFLDLLDQSFWRYSFVEDHLQYLACMGPLALAGAGLTQLVERIVPVSPRWQGALGAGLLLILGFLSWQRAGVYANELTLWTDNLAKNPDCWVGYYNLGNEYVRERRIDEALALYQKSIAINPNYDRAHNNLGNALLQRGQIDAAVAEIERALQINPKSYMAHVSLADAFLHQGRLDEAALQSQEAVDINPKISSAHNNLGNALLRLGRLDEAIAQYQKALQIKPEFAEAHNNLGLALIRKGNVEASIVEFQEAVNLQPNYLDARRNLMRAEMIARQNVVPK